MNKISTMFLSMLLVLISVSTMYADFNPPKTKSADGKGWEEYAESFVINKENAGEYLNLSLTHPESPIVMFYASKIVGDKSYEKALASENYLSKREKRKLKHKFEKMSKWQFLEMKLVKRKKTGDSGNRYWIKIYMKIMIKGREDSGTDEAEVGFFDGKWYLVMPPT